MNTNRDSDSGDKSSEKVTTFSADFSGNLRVGKKSKNTSVYCHKTDRLAQSVRIKGSNGIGEKQEQELYNFASYLWCLHPEQLAWMIIKYDSLTLEQYGNLHLNWDKFHKKLKDLLNNKYGKIFGIDKAEETDFLMPWILKFELSEFRTLATGKPHFDINILLLYLDENREPLFDQKQLARSIYLGISKVSGDHIPMPPDHYFELIDPFKKEFRNWSSYFAKRTDPVLLARCKKNGTDRYFPKQWYICPDQLRREALHRETLESDVSVKKETAIAKDEFKDEIEKVEENKNGAYIRISLEDYDPTECIDRMEERLSELSDRVERL